MTEHVPPSKTRALVPVMTADEVNAFIRQVYSELSRNGDDYYVTEVFPGGATVRLDADERHVRPGGTISGPVLFTLADMAGYVCVISHTGPEALSVTTNLNINFMRKAVPGPLDAKGRILKLGKSLMVYEVAITAGPEGEVVAHATGTYSIPPKR